MPDKANPDLQRALSMTVKLFSSSACFWCTFRRASDTMLFLTIIWKRGSSNGLMVFIECSEDSGTVLGCSRCLMYMWRSSFLVMSAWVMGRLARGAAALGGTTGGTGSATYGAYSTISGITTGTTSEASALTGFAAYGTLSGTKHSRPPETSPF